MAKADPIIQKFMTFQPHAIEAKESVAKAQDMISELQVRHLPVVLDNKVVGVISEYDIKTACSISGSNINKMTVKDICQPDPYIVEPEARLHDVANEMATHHYGCAVVLQNEKLVGIFTTTDACRAIAQLLEQRYHIEH